MFFKDCFLCFCPGQLSWLFHSFWNQNVWFVSYLLHFRPKVPYLHAHLAFLFWLLVSVWFLLAFGFWPLVSLGFWLLLGCKNVVHILYVWEYTAFQLHRHCAETTDICVWNSVHAVVKGVETCFQQSSKRFLFLKCWERYFTSLVEVCPNRICLIRVSQWLHGSRKFSFKFMCMCVCVWTIWIDVKLLSSAFLGNLDVDH